MTRRFGRHSVWVAAALAVLTGCGSGSDSATTVDFHQEYAIDYRAPVSNAVRRSADDGEVIVSFDSLSADVNVRRFVDDNDGDGYRDVVHESDHSTNEGSLDVYFGPEPRADLLLTGFNGAPLDGQDTLDSIELNDIRVDLNRETYDGDTEISNEDWWESARTHTYAREITHFNRIENPTLAQCEESGWRCKLGVDDDGGDTNWVRFPFLGYSLNGQDERGPVEPADDDYEAQNNPFFRDGPSGTGTIYYGPERGLGWGRFHADDDRDSGGRGYGFDIEVQGTLRESDNQ